jgi:cytidylate kinase
MSFVVVALDGPTGVGKSTIARALAERQGFLYVNTGAMFRCLAWKWQQLGCPENVEELTALGSQTRIEMRPDGRIFCDGAEVTTAIRTEEISALASKVSQFSPIRQALKTQQRHLVASAREQAEAQGAVLEGRDIGTVVLPDAECKFFVEASAGVRAQRRFAELQQRDANVRYEDVLQALEQRDAQDRNRTEAPLVPADDAILIDTSHLNIEQVLQELQRHLTPHLATETP